MHNKRPLRFTLPLGNCFQHRDRCLCISTIEYVLATPRNTLKTIAAYRFWVGLECIRLLLHYIFVYIYICACERQEYLFIYFLFVYGVERDRTP